MHEISSPEYLKANRMVGSAFRLQTKTSRSLTKFLEGGGGGGGGE